MGSIALSQLDEQIAHLPYRQQLRLVERIVQRLRSIVPASTEEEDELAAMAADPEIVRENRAISREFAIAEYDGLGELP